MKLSSPSPSNYFVFAFPPAAPCSSPLGVGWDFTLPDSAFSASSTLDVGKKNAVSFSKCMYPFVFLSFSFTNCFDRRQVVDGTAELAMHDCTLPMNLKPNASEPGAQRLRKTSGCKLTWEMKSTLLLSGRKVIGLLFTQDYKNAIRFL